MATPVEHAEAEAKPVLLRLAQCVESGTAFAFHPSSCRAVLDLVDALRANQALDSAGNLVERPCPVCRGAKPDPDADACETCDGLGFMPTKTGQAILDMVERHLISAVEGDDLWVADPVEVEGKARGTMTTDEARDRGQGA